MVSTVRNSIQLDGASGVAIAGDKAYVLSTNAESMAVVNITTRTDFTIATSLEEIGQLESFDGVRSWESSLM